MTVRYLIDGFHDGTSGPPGWPKLFVTLAKDAKPPDGAVVWTHEERDAWERDPARQAEREAWEASRPQPAPPPLSKLTRALALLDLLPASRQAEIVAEARRRAVQGQGEADLFLTRLCAAGEVDLVDPDIVNGIKMLRTLNIISASEEATLLGEA